MSQQALLPPIQQLEQHNQQQQPMQSQAQQHQYTQPSMNGATQIQHHMQPAPHDSYQHYSDNAVPQPMPPNGTPNGQPMRYPLPPQSLDARQMAGGRHKKEIKRRTKTGCLTCRKRRIKCDEGHPSCRNCQKSKRECLGYDPIFKAQGVPAPIQPAPGAMPPMRPEQSSVLPPAYSPAPQGYAPAASAGYAPAAPISAALEQGYDYGATIDPALANGHAPAPPPPEPTPQETYTTELWPERRVKHLAVDDLFAIGNIAPSSPPLLDDSQTPSPEDLHDMRAMYRQDYAPGLDKFFETEWYGTMGEAILEADRSTAHFFKHCINRFRQQPPDFQTLPALEARLVWLLAGLPRVATRNNGGNNNLTPPLALLQRITTVEHLLVGSFSEPHDVPLAPDPLPSHRDDAAYARYLEDSFWHQLSTFTTIRDDDALMAPPPAIDAALLAMRHILSMLENRDVLYSIAIARHFGGRMKDFDHERLLVATSNEPEDPLNKLVIAQTFIAQEEGAGTTQVVQRLCGMARRSWSQQRVGVSGLDSEGAVNGIGEEHVLAAFKAEV